MEGESDDFKDICSLSAILVSKIQEVKECVSQIELDFSSQTGELKFSLWEITQERQKLLKEIECKEESLVTQQSKIRDMDRDFGTLNESHNSLKSQCTDLIKKLEDSERAVEEKKVKPHSSKRSHEDLDEINTEEISPIEMARKSKPDISSTTSARGAPVPRETCRDKLAVEEPTWEEKPVKRQRSQPVARQKPEQTSTPDVVEDEGVRRLREVEPDAKRAVELANRLGTRAQFLKEKAELANYRAIKARRISNALFRRSQTAAPDS